MHKIFIMGILILLSLNTYSKTNASEVYLDQGLELIKDFGQSLQKNLKKSIKSSGLEAGFHYCFENAEFLKNKWEKKTNKKIGRITLKPRNQNNLRPYWMKSLLVEYARSDSKNKLLPRHIKYNSEHFIVKPIYMKPVCLKCHGQSINKSLLKKITIKYPKDKALNYKLGEFRGLFWVKL